MIFSKGFTADGVEMSSKVRVVADKIPKNEKGISIYASNPDLAKQCDDLISFEVLEHIEDDLEALTCWAKSLTSGGLCLISLPADPHRWNIADVQAGYYHRYTRDSFNQLLVGAGLKSREIITYGWPATWFIECAQKNCSAKKV